MNETKKSLEHLGPLGHGESFGVEMAEGENLEKTLLEFGHIRPRWGKEVPKEIRAI